MRKRSRGVSVRVIWRYVSAERLQGCALDARQLGREHGRVVARQQARRVRAVVVRAAVHLGVPVRRAVRAPAAAAVQRGDAQPLAAQPAARAGLARLGGGGGRRGRAAPLGGRGRGRGRRVQPLVAEVQVLARPVPGQRGQDAAGDIFTLYFNIIKSILVYLYNVILTNSVF